MTLGLYEDAESRGSRCQSTVADSPEPSFRRCQSAVSTMRTVCSWARGGKFVLGELAADFEAGWRWRVGGLAGWRVNLRVSRGFNFSKFQRSRIRNSRAWIKNNFTRAAGLLASDSPRYGSQKKRKDNRLYN